MTTIKLYVTGAEVNAYVDGVLTRGMVGIPVKIDYNHAWDGLTKNLICKSRLGSRMVTGVENTATVPHEVMSASGEEYYLGNLLIGIEGRNADGTVVIPTLWADCGPICYGADPNADPTTDPTPPVWAQLQAEIEELKKNGVSDEQIAAAVEEYLEENPVEVVGCVKSVNGVKPDPETGDVEIDIPDSSQNANVATVEPAEDDIPKVFFGGALQQTKTEAVVPFRYISKTQDFSGYAEIKAQGNSSLSYPKKNQTVKMFKDADCTEKLKVDFKGWGKQNKHCYKANWIDLTHARNVVSARIWGDVVKSRANYTELPELYRTSPNHGAVDGFPIKVYAAGIYQGRYSLNIPKDKWMANMDDDLDTHCILCGEGYVSGCFREASVSQWTDEIHDSMPSAIRTRWIEVINFVMNSTDEEFKANLGNYFYVDSLIDYHLYGLLSCGLDAYGKNQLYMTYDGQKWLASMYDMDSTWGLYWNGSKFVATDYARTSYEDFASTQSSGEGNLLFIRLEQLFWEELQTRWAELKSGALSIENIINRFERFTDIAAAELVKEDYAITTGGGKFTGIPSQSTNNIQQIRSFALARQTWTDSYVAALSGESGGGENPEPDIPEVPDHTHSYTSSVTTAATCETAGVRTYNCSCGHSYTEAIPATGHNFVDDVCINCGSTTIVYKFAEPKTFNGTSDYVDTGITLFEENKDFSIAIEFTGGGSQSNLAGLFQCVKEENPWPGVAVDVSHQRAKYRFYNEFCTDIAASDTDKHRIVVVKDAATKTIKLYWDEISNVLTNSNASITGANFDKTFVLGAKKQDNGTMSNYWNGTIHNCSVYTRQLTAEEITAYLNA